MNKKYNFFKGFISFLFFCFCLLGIGTGLISFMLSSENKQNFYWNLIILSFVVGSLILTIRPNALEKKWRESYPRLSFLIILSGIFILIGNGLFMFSQTGGNILYSLGIIMFSLGLSSLMMVLGSHIVKI